MFLRMCAPSALARQHHGATKGISYSARTQASFPPAARLSGSATILALLLALSTYTGAPSLVQQFLLNLRNHVPSGANRRKSEFTRGIRIR